MQGARFLLPVGRALRQHADDRHIEMICRRIRILYRAVKKLFYDKDRRYHQSRRHKADDRILRHVSCRVAFRRDDVSQPLQLHPVHGFRHYAPCGFHNGVQKLLGIVRRRAYGQIKDIRINAALHRQHGGKIGDAVTGPDPPYRAFQNRLAFEHSGARTQLIPCCRSIVDLYDHLRFCGIGSGSAAGHRGKDDGRHKDRGKEDLENIPPQQRAERPKIDLRRILHIVLVHKSTSFII